MYNAPVFTKHNWGSLITFFILSLLCHVLIVITIPNFLSVKRIRIIPVIYITPMELRIKRLPPLPVIKTKSTSTPSRAQVLAGETRFALKKAFSLSSGMGIFLPPPSIQLPVSEFIGKETIEITYTSNKKNQRIIGRYSLKSGLLNLLPKDLTSISSFSVPQVEASFSKNLVRELRQSIQSAQVSSSVPNQLTKRFLKRASNMRFGIEGPIASRKILYRPPLPKVITEHSVQVKLKFWVTSDGIVDQVIPIERGGTKMELVAIHFLKKWRFEPLSPSIKQERQWGVLTVKFLVR